MKDVSVSLFFLSFLAFGCGGGTPAPVEAPKSSSEDSDTMVFDVTPTSDPGPAGDLAVALQSGDEGLQIVVEQEALGAMAKIVAFTSKQVGIDALQIALDNAMAELRHLDQVLNDLSDTSDVAKINSSAGDWVQISEDTSRAIAQAQWCSQISQGAFDITYRTLEPFWNFETSSGKAPSLPEPRALQIAQSKVGFGELKVNEAKLQVRLGAEQRVGLRGMNRGFAVDEMARVLQGAGVQAFLIKIGADYYASGSKPGGVPWSLEIRDPRLSKGSSFASLVVKDAALSTAGDYDHSFFIRDERYHDILDPYTGYPAKESRSVSIWAPTALMADLLDDAVFVLGPQKGLALVESLEGVGAVIVDAKNKVWVSRRIQDLVQIDRQPTDGV